MIRFILLVSMIFAFQASAENYTRVCLEGHTYFNYKSKLAIKLDDAGKPVRCACKSCEQDFSTNLKGLRKKIVEDAKDWYSFGERF
ncbi:MAG: hypothetical protein DRQ88_08080 [Epsilonproteobacteria bacterium]|nr:MAG: hypothetical protein DRQ89_09100 [Campylobacterota bacterium]RLA66010.1 MAG: hypothetical protein DRQ88_08080 [Campylobacterota bacterium]